MEQENDKQADSYMIEVTHGGSVTETLHGHPPHQTEGRDVDQQAAAEPVQNELSATLAQSIKAALTKIPKTFDEKVFLSANLPDEILTAHAQTLTEEEIGKFVDGAAQACNSHGLKISQILEISKPYILRERETYCKQGQRNSRGKSWTDRKKELAGLFGTSVRSFERAVSKFFTPPLVRFNISIAGVVDGLEVKVEEDRVPDLQHLLQRAQSGEIQVDKPVGSPRELWEVIENKLGNCVDDVFHVTQPGDFALRLHEFAQAMADSFFPGTVVEVTPSSELKSRGTAM